MDSETEGSRIKPKKYECAECNKVIVWTGKADGYPYWEGEGRYLCYNCVFGL